MFGFSSRQRERQAAMEEVMKIREAKLAERKKAEELRQRMMAIRKAEAKMEALRRYAACNSFLLSTRGPLCTVGVGRRKKRRSDVSGQNQKSRSSRSQS
jgi:TPP-dependent pyruvate/acetoin dehydrogenase alpha subunit